MSKNRNEFGYLSRFRLVICRTFVWLFGAFLFGYLAQTPMTTRGRLSLARRTLLGFWRLWGIRMNLWSCMIDNNIPT